MVQPWGVIRGPPIMYFQKIQFLGVFRSFIQRSLLNTTIKLWRMSKRCWCMGGIWEKLNRFGLNTHFLSLNTFFYKQGICIHFCSHFFDHLYHASHSYDELRWFDTWNLFHILNKNISDLKYWDGDFQYDIQDFRILQNVFHNTDTVLVLHECL